MNATSADKITFSATPKELAGIKKACTELSGKLGLSVKKGQKAFTVPIDSVEIGSKAYLSALTEGKQTVLKVEMQDGKGINSFTYLPPCTKEESKQFLDSDGAKQVIGDVIDSLKKAVQKAQNTESYKG